MDLPSGTAARHRVLGVLLLALTLLGCASGVPASPGPSDRAVVAFVAVSGSGDASGDGSHGAGHACASQDERCPAGRSEPTARAGDVAGATGAALTPVCSGARRPFVPQRRAAGPGRFALGVIRT
ncbi:hypothetical protein [Streptomyces sp. UG1]|uniref:hypothetical protein n=1 Tax=Streptomyces sp. UG1 TaxID=3417652 RepID=UPI003CE99136